MPVVYEREKNRENNKEVDFHVRSLDILSANEAILNIINMKTALGMHNILKFSIAMSRVDGGTNKLNFEVNIITQDINTATNKIQIKGDLTQAINFLTRSYISESTNVEALKIISDFSHEKIQINSSRPLS